MTVLISIPRVCVGVTDEVYPIVAEFPNNSILLFNCNSGIVTNATCWKMPLKTQGHYQLGPTLKYSRVTCCGRFRTIVETRLKKL